MKHFSVARGFTLIELVAVIIILSVVGTTVVSFIGFSAQLFVDVNGRDKALGDSRFVVERLNRELRNAIPNSIRVITNPGVHCIEFMPIVWSTFYLDLPVAPAPARDTIRAVVLEDIDNQSFDTTNIDSYFAVIYPVSSNSVYASGGQNSRPLLGINSVSAEVVNVVLASAIQFPAGVESPTSRLYIGGQPVSYCVSGGQIRRHTNYNVLASQPTFTNGGALMGENLQNVLSDNFDAPFSVSNSILTRNAFVNILLRFAREDQPGEVIVFSNEVQVANVP